MKRYIKTICIYLVTTLFATGGIYYIKVRHMQMLAPFSHSSIVDKKVYLHNKILVTVDHDCNKLKELVGYFNSKNYFVRSIKLQTHVNRVIFNLQPTSKKLKQADYLYKLFPTHDYKKNKNPIEKKASKAVINKKSNMSFIHIN